MRAWELDAADTSGLRMGGAVGDFLAPAGWGVPGAQEAEKEVGLRTSLRVFTSVDLFRLPACLWVHAGELAGPL